MDKPTSCRIGSTDFEIIWEDYAWMRSANATGQFDAMLATIRIYGDQQPSRLLGTFMHEIMHGLIESCPNGTLKDDLLKEEAVCDIVGYTLIDFFRTNPHIFKWYTEMLGIQ